MCGNDGCRQLYTDTETGKAALVKHKGICSQTLQDKRSNAIQTLALRKANKEKVNDNEQTRMREIVKKGGKQEQTKANKRINEGQAEMQPKSSNRHQDYVGKYGFFQGNTWDQEMRLWRGKTVQNVPTNCVQEFREILCEVAEEAKTGCIEAIRAINIYLA